jgi:hypothetical protein
MLFEYFLIDIQMIRNSIFVTQYEKAESAIQPDQGGPGRRGDIEQTVGRRARRNGTDRFDLVYERQTTFFRNLVFNR